MRIFTVGTPIVSASLATTKESGEVVTNVIAKGDTLTGVVLAAPKRRCRPGCCVPAEDITIETCTVVGFTVHARRVYRGATTIIDGVASYMNNPDGACSHGTMESTAEIKDMVVEIPAEEEGAIPVHHIINIARIKDIGGVTGTEVPSDPPQA